MQAKYKSKGLRKKLATWGTIGLFSLVAAQNVGCISEDAMYSSEQVNGDMYRYKYRAFPGCEYIVNLKDNILFSGPGSTDDRTRKTLSS